MDVEKEIAQRHKELDSIFERIHLRGTVEVGPLSIDDIDDIHEQLESMEIVIKRFFYLIILIFSFILLLEYFGFQAKAYV